MHQMGRFLDLSKKPSPESASECVRGIMNPCSQGGLLRCDMALGTNDCWAMRMYAGEKVGGPSLALGQEVTFHDAQIRNLILKCLFNIVDLVIHVAVCVLFKVMTRTFLLACLYADCLPLHSLE
jgi:hypothetical protein